MQKTKITEIRESYLSKQRIRNAKGEWGVREVTLTRFKQVEYIEGWSRFGAFLLDSVFILIFEVIIGFALGIFLALTDMVDLLDDEQFDLFFRILSYLVFRPLYYIIFEGSMQGSPAKLILGRIVVNEYGEKPTFKQILGRSYARIVPFEAFSCLGTLGWHDTWSDTFVITKKHLSDLQTAIKIQDFGKQDQSNALDLNAIRM